MSEYVQCYQLFKGLNCNFKKNEDKIKKKLPNYRRVIVIFLKKYHGKL